jgi:heme/copper-type cytochrome/quinol oxidase subunit 2
MLLARLFPVVVLSALTTTAGAAKVARAAEPAVDVARAADPAAAVAAKHHLPRRVDVVIEGHFGHFVPTEIRAQYGDTIHVTLKAMDSAHGFMVEDHAFDITAYPGMPAEVTFVADWVGGKEWYCTFDCGPQHGTMSGMIVVTKD